LVLNETDVGTFRDFDRGTALPPAAGGRPAGGRISTSTSDHVWGGASFTC
jgi:hypothetical protein